MTKGGIRQLHMGCGEPLTGAPGLAGQRDATDNTQVRERRAVTPKRPERERRTQPR